MFPLSSWLLLLVLDFLAEGFFVDGEGLVDASCGGGADPGEGGDPDELDEVDHHVDGHGVFSVVRRRARRASTFLPTRSTTAASSAAVVTMGQITVKPTASPIDPPTAATCSANGEPRWKSAAMLRARTRRPTTAPTIQ